MPQTGKGSRKNQENAKHHRGEAFKENEGSSLEKFGQL
jgi:hypothetical protein